jgi:hypothetical protein
MALQFPEFNLDGLTGPMKAIARSLVTSQSFKDKVTAYVNALVVEATAEKEAELAQKEADLAVFPTFEMSGDDVALRNYAKSKYNELPPIIRTALEEEAEARVAQRIAASVT